MVKVNYMTPGGNGWLVQFSIRLTGVENRQKGVTTAISSATFNFPSHKMNYAHEQFIEQKKSKHNSFYNTQVMASSPWLWHHHQRYTFCPEMSL